MINVAKAKTTKLGYTVRLVYQISIHTCDIEILQRLKEYFKRGEVIEAARYVHFRVTNLKDIQKFIIPHFSSYPLQSTKVVSYTLFKQVATIISNKEHLILDGFNKVLRLKAALPKGLEAAVFKDSRFSDTAPFDTSNIFVKYTSKLPTGTPAVDETIRLMNELH
jgi:hypothetical protein